MATINAYGVRFIGNDMVAQRPMARPQPRPRIEPIRRQHFTAAPRQMPVAPQPQPQYIEQPMVAAAYQYEQEEQDAELFSAQMPFEEHERARIHMPAIHWGLSRRTILIASSIAVGAGLLVIALPRSGEIMSLGSTETSKMSAAVMDALHSPVQQNFVMPAHSLLVRNDVLSNYVDSVEGQQITINIGTSSVTPLPTDIANWIKTSNGPEVGTSLLSVNVSSVSQYVAKAMQNSPKQPGDLTSINTEAQSAAVNQIAQSLLKYRGMTVTIPSQS